MEMGGVRMPGMRVNGVKELISTLEKLGEDTETMCQKSLYEGAGIVADNMKSQIQGLKTSSTKYVSEGKKRYLTEEEKEGLLDSLGIAPQQIKGTVIDTKTGFDGYNKRKTKKHPAGQPNLAVARTCDRGNSFMYAQPIFRPVIQKSRAAVLKATKEELLKEMKKRGIKVGG